MKKFHLTLLAVAISGCGTDDAVNDPHPVPPTGPVPPTLYTANLVTSGIAISGDVECNGDALSDGIFTVEQGAAFSCTFGAVDLGSYIAPEPNPKAAVANSQSLTSFDVADIKGENATRVLKSIDANPADSDIQLALIDSYDIADVFTQLDDQSAVDAFLTPKVEDATDEVGKAPSSHVDPNVVPAVTPGASNSLDANFVSANAESALVYQPSAEAAANTRAVLTDANGVPLVGVSFFSQGATGITDANGEFDYVWGDELTFGLDTFEFGRIRGNKLDFKLTDVSESAVAKANIQSLIERYTTLSGATRQVPSIVLDTFALYPNVINELINFNLPNGGEIDDSGFHLPNEFNQQFDNGLTKVVDQAIQAKLPRMTQTMFDLASAPQVIATEPSGYVTETLKQMFDQVTTFHVFHDNGSFYGASGYARGMRSLNMNNRAFPVVSARTDINKNQNFGEPQAWSRDGKPYIATHPTIVMPAVPTISKENAVYGLPFVTAGEIGAGKVLFMGNGMYPSILSCPENYWVNGALSIDSAAQTCSTNPNAYVNANHDDNGSMATFFSNVFKWFNQGNSTSGLNIATNIDKGYASWVSTTEGREYDFFVNPAFGFGSVETLSSGGYAGLSPETTPILLLQAYPPLVIGDGMTQQFVADLDHPNLTQDDIAALIAYVHAGGNILFMDGIQTQNPEPIARLADAAGVAIGGTNVAHTDQVNCGSSYYCHGDSLTPNLHAQGEHDMVVLERFEDIAGEGQPYTVQDDGSVEWVDDPTKIVFGIPQYEVAKLDADGNPVIGDDGLPEMVSKYARIFVQTEQEKTAAIAELQAAFPSYPLCNHDYQYEFNCIEVRQGDGITDRGNYGRADFDRYEISSDTIAALVKSSNLGDNVEALYHHEMYYRTKGAQGTRLSETQLNQTYDSLSVWMWNDNNYGYDGSHHHDELGFQTAVEFLNCYTSNAHGQGASCPAELKASLESLSMLHANGELNPSYPLNYMEKPLTRIMLGRSYWDPEIVVDTTSYPGRPEAVTLNASVNIETSGSAVSYTAGNRQATGLWAPQLETVTVSGGVPATITVMLADDLTGLSNHETALKRPPRMQKQFAYDGVSLSFSVPYGGLIYVQPNTQGETASSFNFNGVVKAPYWKEGVWVNEASSPAPIAEIDTGDFLYTTPSGNLARSDIDEFARKMNLFGDAINDFYGRDEITAVGQHRRFTYPELKGFRHHYVNDVQISVGAAHSGYPVMASGFDASAETISMEPLNSWLLWHEFGHNVAAAPFNAPGSTEVTNNLLALYMQEHEERGDAAKMVRLTFDIQKAPLWLSQNSGHAWANGDAGMRLVMFGQLKVWAKANFAIDDWYQTGVEKPSVYGADEGWNMFKLMHRKARGDVQGDSGKNFCSASVTGLSNGDLMMVCSSYVSGYDLSAFYTAWNVGEKSTTLANGDVQYEGGISDKGHAVMEELQRAVSLKSTSGNDPLAVNSIH
ncbi:SslE/AcfD family lipoprotein zinc metalloprotease [Vibrio sp. SM6]|uniref:SslE/AcfD family lipoprotein zinc metalloprotease n=1 Tax=Vibrio agarilyticus TaxID=2726741 RepID=A0A7X8YIB5_9VIBR|nr:SslE/AcfD family lipoprotein zinc metalloprotease [Vibrio agarilyticus]NLS14544.1 SslE/AcfD family lipoprotein zinc metalloprotease [Vibrio agarilyticus]